jgi:hypothetical protein
MSDEKAVNMDVEAQRSLDQKIGQTEYIDSGAKFLAEAEDYTPLSPEAEKRLIRKVDWTMIPMLFITATFGAVDKVALGTAAIYGLQTDANLHGQQYSWLGSILSLGVGTALGCSDVRLTIRRHCLECFPRPILSSGCLQPNISVAAVSVGQPWPF